MVGWVASDRTRQATAWGLSPSAHLRRLALGTIGSSCPFVKTVPPARPRRLLIEGASTSRDWTEGRVQRIMLAHSDAWFRA